MAQWRLSIFNEQIDFLNSSLGVFERDVGLEGCDMLGSIVDRLAYT